MVSNQSKFRPKREIILQGCKIENPNGKVIYKSCKIESEIREIILQGCKIDSENGKPFYKVVKPNPKSGNGWNSWKAIPEMEGENFSSRSFISLQHATERDAHAKALHDQFVIGRDRRVCRPLQSGTESTLLPLETNHPAELPVCDQLWGMSAKACSEVAVVGVGLPPRCV